MNTVVKKYFSVHPTHAQSLNTQQLREHFLLTDLFISGSVQLRYSHYDRMIAGGIMPGANKIKLETTDVLKAEFFLERREMYRKCRQCRCGDRRRQGDDAG